MSVDDIIKERFEEYTLALGKVAHSWNYLQERLGSLFAVVAGENEGVAFAIWYSSTSDRAQREMLKAAVQSVTATLSHPKAQEDIVWLIDKANHYSERRNDAVHAPRAMALGTRKFEIVPAFFNGHPRAKNLLGKDILKEFNWYESVAEQLSKFAGSIRTAMLVSSYPWPDRPALPGLGAKGNSQPQRRQVPQ